MPPPDNDIDEDRPHTWIGSGGGGTVMPSVSAPHRSLDSVTSQPGEQSLQDESETTDMWQSGRGIRAHDSNTGIYNSQFFFQHVLSLPIAHSLRLAVT